MKLSCVGCAIINVQGLKYVTPILLSQSENSWIHDTFLEIEF